MNDRLDALSDAPSRRGLFPAPLLETDEDPILQALVRDAAESLGAPIALVSFVLDRIQFFRAHVGLPDDLAAARATDRDVSFCQLVVRDGVALAVEDAGADARVPQTLVRTHGVRAYLGAPVRVDDAVLGSLCVIDGQARVFTDEDRAALTALAERVSVRCAELAAAATGARLAHQVSATQDAFPELRNQLLMLESGLEEARYERAQIAPVLRAAAFGGATSVVLQEARAALSALEERLAESAHAAARIGAQVVALESVLEPTWRPADLDTALDRAIELSRHLTKLLPGVTLPPAGTHPELRASQGTAVAVLTNVLRAVGWRGLESGAGRFGLDIGRRDEADAVVLIVRAAGQPAEVFTDAAAELSETAGRREGVEVAAVSDGLEVRFSPR